MYVCICNGYRESEVREVAAEGAKTVDDAYTCLGSGPCCRRCVHVAQQIINDVHETLDWDGAGRLASPAPA